MSISMKSGKHASTSRPVLKGNLNMPQPTWRTVTEQMSAAQVPGVVENECCTQVGGRRDRLLFLNVLQLCHVQLRRQLERVPTQLRCMHAIWLGADAV